MTDTELATAAPDRAGSRRPIPDIVQDAADTHIRALQSGYLRDHPDAVASLARIRRGVGKPVHAVPDLWGLTGTELLYSEIDERRRPEDFLRAENAVHIAVTLWALHQQSRRDVPMHVTRGPHLGRAVRDLMPQEQFDEPIRRRFVRVGTASSLDVLTQRLRDIVLLLRQEARPMDYGVLATQLYRWQQPGGRGAVHREWGRNFHARAQPGPVAAPTSTSDKKEAS